MRRLIGIGIALVTAAAAVLLAMTPVRAQRQLETDPDERARCVGILLVAEGSRTVPEAGIVIGTLNYTDKHYGGPCAALEHYLEHGWY